MTYGGDSCLPSTMTPPTPSSNDVWAITRTSPLICIASAPALRSSWTVSSIESMSTGPSTSSTVIRTPGPVTGTVPARMSRLSASVRACSSAASRALVLDCRSSRARSRRVISACARWEEPARPLSTSIRACSR